MSQIELTSNSALNELTQKFERGLINENEFIAEQMKIYDILN